MQPKKFHFNIALLLLFQANAFSVMCLLTFSILPHNTPKKYIHKNTVLLPSMTLQVKPALWRLKYMNGVLMPSVTFHGEISRSAAAAQQADSIKIGFLQRLMPCMQYATAFGYNPQGLAIKSAVFYHRKNVQQYSIGEPGRLPHRLGSSAPCCLRSPSTAAATTKNHQQPSALGFDFSYHDARCLVLREQLLPPWSPETGLRAAAKVQPLTVPAGPLIVLRKVLGREGRVLSVHGPLPANHPRRSMDIPHLSARAKNSFVLTLAHVPKRHPSSGSLSAPQVNIFVSLPAITQWTEPVNLFWPYSTHTPLRCPPSS